MSDISDRYRDIVQYHGADHYCGKLRLSSFPPMTVIMGVPYRDSLLFQSRRRAMPRDYTAMRLERLISPFLQSF